MKKLFLLCLFLLLTGSCWAAMISVTHLPAELRDRQMVAGSQVLRELPRYAPLEVLDLGPAYLQVKDYTGTTGYIHKSLTGKVPSIVVTGAKCNVRSGPGTEFPVVFTAVEGDCFKVDGQEQDWLQISSEQGDSGWIWQPLTWGYQ